MLVDTDVLIWHLRGYPQSSQVDIIMIVANTIQAR
jgi:hypothetical protein